MEAEQVAVVSSDMILVTVVPLEVIPSISHNTVVTGVTMLEIMHSKSSGVPSVMLIVSPSARSTELTERVRSDMLGATEKKNQDLTSQIYVRQIQK